MAELKTTVNDGDVRALLEAVEGEQKRDDCLALLQLMQEVTKEPPKMWGGSMVGFGSYHYRYESGREGDWFLTGFSPRKQNLSLYIMAGFERFDELMGKLGKHKTGKSCLYVKKLEDIDLEVLKELVQHSVAHMREKYG